MSETSSKKILIVDDEPDIIEILSFVLEEEGYEVITASSGNSALDIIKNSDEDINFVITDIQMNKGSGIEFLEECKKVQPNTPVLLMSGFSNYNKKEILEKGALDILSKPFEIDDLIEYILTKIK